MRILQSRRDVIRRLFGARASRHSALPFLGREEANFLPQIGGRDFRCAGMSPAAKPKALAVGLRCRRARTEQHSGLARGDSEMAFSAAS